MVLMPFTFGMHVKDRLMSAVQVHYTANPNSMIESAFEVVGVKAFSAIKDGVSSSGNS
jgi:hypothetical protein